VDVPSRDTPTILNLNHNETDNLNPLQVDIPSIVCCRGDSPVLDSVIDVRVPLQLSFLPSLTTDAAQRILGDADALSLCRAYLAYVRLLDWELEEVSSAVALRGTN
jgi:hypothetical protein